MEIKNARFVISSSHVKDCPSHGLPEYAFIGRSNVGKSSLINMLTCKKGLAMTSSTPGKTMLINHFFVDNSWYLVDLPGYGYARRGKESREALREMIEGFVPTIEQDKKTSHFLAIKHIPLLAHHVAESGRAPFAVQCTVHVPHLPFTMKKDGTRRSPPGVRFGMQRTDCLRRTKQTT